MRIIDARSTSVVAAIVRASHQILDHQPRIFDDPLAVGLVDGSSEEEIRRDQGLLEDPMFRAARCLITYRSRYCAGRTDGLRVPRMQQLMLARV